MRSEEDGRLVRRTGRRIKPEESYNYHYYYTFMDTRRQNLHYIRLICTATKRTG